MTPMALDRAADVAAESRALGDAAQRLGELLDTLPEPARRSAKQRTDAEEAKATLRASRARFLDAHVDTVYAELTEDGRLRPRLSELGAMAAQTFPGLLPTADQLARERTFQQSDKEGLELDQGVFFHWVLRSAAAGPHLVASMLRPGAEALRLLPKFQRTGRCELGSVRIERLDAAAHLTLSRDDCLNAEDDAQVADLEIAVDLAHLDPGVRVGVLRGGVVSHPKYRGRRVFSAGINLKALHAGRISFVEFILGRELGYISKMVHGVWISDDEPPRQLPWVGAVDSFAIGGGAQLLLVLDLVIAAADSYLSLPAAQEGIIPGASSFRLSRAVPMALARQLLLHGRRVYAHEPDARYFIDQVIEPGEMDAAVTAGIELLDHAAVVANRKMFRLAEEPIDEFRRYLAEFALEQSRRLYSDDVLRKVGRFSSRGTR